MGTPLTSGVLRAGSRDGATSRLASGVFFKDDKSGKWLELPNTETKRTFQTQYSASACRDLVVQTDKTRVYRFRNPTSKATLKQYAEAYTGNAADFAKLLSVETDAAVRRDLNLFVQAYEHLICTMASECDRILLVCPASSSFDTKSQELQVVVFALQKSGRCCEHCCSTSRELTVCVKCESALHCTECWQHPDQLLHDLEHCKEQKKSLATVQSCLTPCYRVCAQCFGKAQKKCSRCLSVRYCSSECQTTDWTAQHKRECGALRRPVTPPAAGCDLVLVENDNFCSYKRREQRPSALRGV